MQLRLLGPMAVIADGKALQLPASRKTRALLGYLAAEAKPIRRDRLIKLDGPPSLSDVIIEDRRRERG